MRNMSLLRMKIFVPLVKSILVTIMTITIFTKDELFLFVMISK